MQIFFTASLRAKHEMATIYQAIYNQLKQDHTVFADHILQLSPESVKTWSEEFHFEYYQLILGEIKRADLLVAEMTNDSINIGYEVNIALQQAKPVIVLYLGRTIPKMIRYLDGSLTGERLLLAPYTKGTFDQALAQALRDAQAFLGKRFTVTLPVKTINALDKMAANLNLSRNLLIQQIVEAETLNLPTEK